MGLDERQTVEPSGAMGNRAAAMHPSERWDLLGYACVA